MVGCIGTSNHTGNIDEENIFRSGGDRRQVRCEGAIGYPDAAIVVADASTTGIIITSGGGAFSAHQICPRCPSPEVPNEQLLLGVGAQAGKGPITGGAFENDELSIRRNHVSHPTDSYSTREEGRITVGVG